MRRTIAGAGAPVGCEWCVKRRRPGDAGRNPRWRDPHTSESSPTKTCRLAASRRNRFQPLPGDSVTCPIGGQATTKCRPRCRRVHARNVRIARATGSSRSSWLIVPSTEFWNSPVSAAKMSDNTGLLGGVRWRRRFSIGHTGVTWIRMARSTSMCHFTTTRVTRLSCGTYLPRKVIARSGDGFLSSPSGDW